MSKLHAFKTVAFTAAALNIQTAMAFDGFDHDEILYKTDSTKSTITVEVNTKKAHAPNSFTATHAHDATIYKRMANLNGHKIETTIRMWKPQGTGFGGAFPRWTMIIKRDGKILYDTTFGHNHFLDIDIYKVVVDANKAKVDLTWVAEIDDSSHTTTINAESAAIDDKALEHVKKSYEQR